MLDGGHVIHEDNPSGVLAEIVKVLESSRQDRICISMDGDCPGSVSIGTVEDETATQSPRAIRPIPTTRVSRGPSGKTFSTKITAAITNIQNTLITPSANRTAIRPRQQPTQYRPFSTPAPRAPCSPRSCGLAAAQQLLLQRSQLVDPGQHDHCTHGVRPVLVQASRPRSSEVATRNSTYATMLASTAR